MKLVATLQPRTGWERRARTLHAMGFRGFRVNFGPCSTPANARLVRGLRFLFATSNGPPLVVADLPGRKLRLLDLPVGPRRLEKGATQRFVAAGGPASPTGLRLSDDRLEGALEPGDVVAVGDARLVVQTVAPGAFTAEVSRVGRVWLRCAVCAPARYRARHRLLPEDLEALTGGAAEADMVCVSFADTPEVMDEARTALARLHRVPALVAKIETPLALQSAASIVAASDGLMVGRGDLSLFLEDEEVDAAARDLVSLAKRKGITVALATDYFRSVGRGGADLTPGERTRLREVEALAPDLLILNETSTSDHWRAAAEAAVRWRRA